MNINNNNNSRLFRVLVYLLGLFTIFTILILLLHKVNKYHYEHTLLQLIYQNDRIPFDENSVEIIDGKNIRFCWKDFENKTNCAVYKLEEYKQAIEYLKSKKRPINISNIM